jgi:hypothetical protein
MTDDDPPADYCDHICRKNDPPCPIRKPSGRYYRGGPPDMAKQCRTCKYVKRCLAAEFDIEFIPLDTTPEESL